MSQPVEHVERERLGWHRLDAVSLVAGLVLCALALGSLLDVAVDGAVVVAVLLVAGGVIGLLTALRRR